MSAASLQKCAKNLRKSKEVCGKSEGVWESMRQSAEVCGESVDVCGSCRKSANVCREICRSVLKVCGSLKTAKRRKIFSILWAQDIGKTAGYGKSSVALL